jgi:uncharacterized protein YjiS (DUF1127 family)
MLRFLAVRFPANLRSDIDSGEPSAPHPLIDIIAAFSQRRRVRLAERELEDLDDHMLKDIGISRSEIAAAARYGRGCPPPTTDCASEDH